MNKRKFYLILKNDAIYKWSNWKMKRKRNHFEKWRNKMSFLKMIKSHCYGFQIRNHKKFAGVIDLINKIFLYLFLYVYMYLYLLLYMYMYLYMYILLYLYMWMYMYLYLLKCFNSIFEFDFSIFIFRFLFSFLKLRKNFQKDF